MQVRSCLAHWQRVYSEEFLRHSNVETELPTSFAVRIAYAHPHSSELKRLGRVAGLRAHNRAPRVDVENCGSGCGKHTARTRLDLFPNGFGVGSSLERCLHSPVRSLSLLLCHISPPLMLAALL